MPFRQKRSSSPAILVRAYRRKTERAEYRFDFLVGNVRAHHTENLRAGHAYLFWCALSRIWINDARQQLPSGKLQNQFRATPRGDLRHLWIGAAAESCGCFRV